jgi:hypothetical protein
MPPLTKVGTVSIPMEQLLNMGSPSGSSGCDLSATFDLKIKLDMQQHGIWLAAVFIAHLLVVGQC